MMEGQKSHEYPNRNMFISAMGILAIKKHERRVFHYYDDAGKNKGNCTYGYGTLVHIGVCTEDELKIKVTEKMIESSLNSKIREFEGFIRREVTYPLNQKQFDALVSFVYNRGPGNSRLVIRMINEGNLNGAADRMQRDITGKVGNKSVIMKGLIIRRMAESAPFRIDNTNEKQNK